MNPEKITHGWPYLHLDNLVNLAHGKLKSNHAPQNVKPKNSSYLIYYFKANTRKIIREMSLCRFNVKRKFDINKVKKSFSRSFKT